MMMFSLSAKLLTNNTARSLRELTYNTTKTTFFFLAYNNVTLLELVQHNTKYIFYQSYPLLAMSASDCSDYTFRDLP